MVRGCKVFIVTLVLSALLASLASAAEKPWWEQGKIRFFWGQWSHTYGVGITPDRLMGPLARIGATVYVHHAPEPVPEQLKVASAAKKAGVRYFGVLYVTNLAEIAAKMKAPLAVDAKGESSEHLPDPFYKPAYEEWFLKPAMELAKSGLVDGLHVDWEFYGGNGEGRDLYNDEYFYGFLKKKGVSATVEAKDRYAWLNEKGLRNDYLAYLRDLTKEMFAGFAAQIRAIKPDFVFSSYDGFFGDNLEGGGWRVSGISAGLHSPKAPYFVIDPRHYWDYSASPWWDSFYSYHHKLGYKHIGGTWDNRFSGGQPQTEVGLVQWMYETSMQTDGYWLWFEREFGPQDWQNFAAADRAIKATERRVGKYLMKGTQDNKFVTVVEWSGNPEMERKIKQRTYHLGNDHLVRVCDVDSYRPLQVRLRFSQLLPGLKWTVQDPIAGLYYTYDGKTPYWESKQLLEGVVLPIEKRSEQYLLVSPARNIHPLTSTLIANQVGAPLRQGFHESPNPEAVPGNPGSADRVLLLKTVGQGNWGAQGGWVIGSGIYSADVKTNAVQRLRYGNGDFWSPTWSPDRNQILFTHFANGRGQVYVMNSDGNGVVNLSKNDFCDKLPSWSPNGNKVAFVSDRDGDWEIYVMNADGSRQTRLTNSPGEDTRPTWSPDGKKIAFETDRGVSRAVYTMNPNGSSQTSMISLAGDILDPAWSPDGKMLAATGLTSYQRGLVLANVDTGKVTVPTQPFLQVESVRWSPDSTRVAAIFYNDQERDNSGIAIFDLADRNARKTTGDGTIGPAGQVESVTCKKLVDASGIRPHPGGGRTGFPSWYGFGSQSPHWVVKLFGGLSWSPDGKSVAFSSDMDSSGGFYTYTVPAITEKNNDRVGFYLYRPGVIDNVVVYTKGDSGEWKEVFRDDFERKELGKDWKTLEGQFSIEDGKLVGSGTLICARSFDGNQRMEFEALARTAPVGDLSAFISATADGFQDGALSAFGSFDNAYSKLHIKGKEVVKSDNRIVPGRLYKISCERDGVNFRHLIDGAEIHKYVDTINKWITGAQTSGEPVKIGDSASAWPQDVYWGNRF